jgi:hypothetical protein
VTAIASLRVTTVRPALVLATALLAVVGLALVSSMMGCGRSAGTPASGVTPSGWDDAGRSSRDAAGSSPGAIALATARVLAQTAGPRVADTWGEIRAREFIGGTFQQYGYVPRTQEFIAGSGSRRVHSANIVAVKEGVSGRRLVVVAHYDAATPEGFVDNAVGVGLLLEMAARLRASTTPYTLVFVALGAEESGRRGSRHYVETMSAAERDTVVGIVNLDAVAGGEELHVTTMRGGATWLRDDLLVAADEIGIELRSASAASERSGADMSDAAFSAAGMATVVLTSGRRSAAAGDATARAVSLNRHADRGEDSVEAVQRAHPGRVRTQLSDSSRLLELILTSELETHS